MTLADAVGSVETVSGADAVDVPVSVNDTLDTDCVCVADSTVDPVDDLGTTVVVTDAMVDDDTTVFVD